VEGLSLGWGREGNYDIIPRAKVAFRTEGAEDNRMLVGKILIGLACASAGMAQINPALLLHPDYKPLTAKERLAKYVHDAYLSPEPYLASLGAAAGQQLHKDPPEWGQGAEAYAKRTATMFGVVTIQATVHQGLAAAMGLEPRYIRCDCAGFLPRTGHAIKMSFLTWDKEGRTRIDLPAMAGAYAGGMISQYWYPARFHPLTDGVRVGTQQFGVHVGVDILREFKPEFRRAFHFRP